MVAEYFSVGSGNLELLQVVVGLMTGCFDMAVVARLCGCSVLARVLECSVGSQACWEA